MKNTLKKFGIIAITAVIVFSMAACIINLPDDPNLPGGVLDAPTGLTATATSTTEIQLSWSAVGGATGYYVYQQTSSGFQKLTGYVSTPSATINSLSPNTSYSFQVSAFNGNGEGARSSTVSATTLSSGGGNVGSGTQANPIQLYNNQWVDGFIAADLNPKELWYTFTKESVGNYRVWWNESGSNGDGTKTLDAIVSAYDSNGTELFKKDTGGYAQAGTLISATGVIKLKVVPYSSGRTGTFSIVYSSTNFNSRPSVPGAQQGSSEDIPIQMNAINTWTVGNMATGGQVWYSFPVTNGSTYYFWLNDKSQGNSVYSADVYIAAWYGSNGENIFTGVDSAYNAARSFVASKNDTIKVRVTPYSSSTGTYAITYATSNSRP